MTPLARRWQKRYPAWRDPVIDDTTSPPAPVGVLWRSGRLVVHRSVIALVALIVVAGAAFMSVVAGTSVVEQPVVFGYIVVWCSTFAVPTIHHELAHAFMVRRSGHEVIQFGIRARGA
jgi:hypothetical protein